MPWGRQLTNSPRGRPASKVTGIDIFPENDMTHPQPHTIAITGAGTGIGAACARRFAARGDRVQRELLPLRKDGRHRVNVARSGSGAKWFPAPQNDARVKL